MSERHCFSVQGRAHCSDGSFPTGLNSHTVAAITTAAPKSRFRRGRAQEGEAILLVGD
jgi:hypothetical protein